MESKPYKFKEEEFTVTKGNNAAKICELVVTGKGMELTVKASDEIYGYGYRIYHPSGWKGSWRTPEEAINAACDEIIRAKQRKNEKELCEDFSVFFHHLT